MLDDAPAPNEVQAIKLFQSGRLSEAEQLINTFLLRHGTNATMLNLLGCIAVQQDQHLNALKHFKRAHQAAPANQDFIDNLVAARGLALSKYQLAASGGDYGKAVTALREVLAVDSGRSVWINELMHCITAAKTTAQLADFAPELDQASLGLHIVIACMPKSGSTFLNQTLQALTGWEDTYLSFAFQQNEEELHLPYLREAATRNTITQQHFRATEPNLQLLQAFDITPLIQVRRLYDIVVSYTDFLDGGATANTFFVGRWETFDRSGQIDLVIDNLLPWYFAFYASWMDAIDQARLDCLIVSYEDLIADKTGTLKQIADFYALDKTLEECAKAVTLVDGQKDKTRFNTGISGRGDELSEKQKDRVRMLADYYPDVDHSRLGL
ncbi:MAG: sulfotransferase domain-containing protein [Alphaproteobacteria bacterium]|nr:sulfotransferase domain-containing protein [Alphaproteobacteria bacterium]